MNEVKVNHVGAVKVGQNLVALAQVINGRMILVKTPIVYRLNRV
ncbi:hypothetical protein [Helicobacter cetorum]|nr:hypothetical protein [Helicobacter cetorum]